jgi:hypothetical protein
VIADHLVLSGQLLSAPPDRRTGNYTRVALNGQLGSNAESRPQGGQRHEN